MGNCKSSRRGLAHVFGVCVMLGGCYDGIDPELEEAVDDPEGEMEVEPGPVSEVSCEPTMSVFPVAAAHNIGWDKPSCGNGACAVSCPDANANSDWNGPAGHNGVDVFAHPDAPLVAVTDGVVTAVGTPSDTSGLRVRIRDACGWEYYYGHMSGAAVVKGQQVGAGQLIGTMGSSGANSVHLHFNVSRDGDYENDIDPTDLLRWTSATACGAQSPPDDGNEPPPAEEGCGALLPGQALFVDEALTSCDGRYALVLQGDGNAVVYEVGAGATWDTKTVGRSSSALVMQDDGNLVIYDEGGIPVWHTVTHGHPGARLQMQSDGNLVIYEGQSAIWSIR